MQEAEIRRIAILGQPAQKSLWDPISMEKKLYVVVLTCHLSYCRKLKIGKLWSRLAWTLSPK
jgi:hypothetical protein